MHECISVGGQWKGYFEDMVTATCPSLTEEEMFDLCEKMDVESICLELYELTDAEKNSQLLKIARRLYSDKITSLDPARSSKKHLAKVSNTQTITSKVSSDSESIADKNTAIAWQPHELTAEESAKIDLSIIDALKNGDLDDCERELYEHVLACYGISYNVVLPVVAEIVSTSDNSVVIAPSAQTASIYTPTNESKEATQDALVTGYPSMPLDLSTVTHESLVASSIELASQFRKNKDYLEIRDEFINVSLALNRFGLLAPLFRDQPRIPYAKSKRDASHKQLLIDLIVIDLHWLYCRKENVSPRWPELKKMFDHTWQFDCAVVSELIADRNWSAEFRTSEILQLNNRQQVQLVQLRDANRKDNYRALVEGVRELDSTNGNSRKKAKVQPIRQVINEWADRTHQIRGHEEMYEALWLAKELLGHDARIKQIAELAALRCGVKPLSARTVADKLKQLDAVLIKASLIHGVTTGA
jgi:hypothetical protein